MSLRKELRHAARRLVRAPGFTIAAALTLALGIGANTAIFTVVDRVMLRPLPYHDADRLIDLDHVAPGINLPEDLGLSQGLYRYYGERARTLESLAISRRAEYTLTDEGPATLLVAVVATATYAEVLGVAPELGRWFTEDEAQDNIRMVVLSHGLWAGRFGADPAILGRSIRLNGIAREVVGVMPPDFAEPEVQLWAPERIDEEQAQSVGGFNYQSVARLAPGADVAAVKTELDGLIGGLKEAFAGDPVAQMALDAAQLASLPEPLRDVVVGPVRQTLWVVLGMVGLVLLIACVNVANLFLVRSESRQREVAVRRALGAGRGGIARFFLSESLLLAVVGGAVGAGLAWLGVRLLVAFGPDNLPRRHEIAMDFVGVGYALVLAVTAGLVFGAIPLIRRTAALAPELREGGRNSTAGQAKFRARNLLMAGQVALALVLLVGSGLMARSFLRLRAVDPGFDAANVLTFDIRLSGTDYTGRESAVAFHDALLERLNGLPGVESAGAASCLPLRGSCWGDPLVVRGRPLQPGELPPIAQIRRALPGFFETLRVPLLAGRTLEPADHEQRHGSVVISRTFADLYFPNEDPLGQQVTFMFGPEDRQPPWYTVVGIVGDLPVEDIAAESFPLIFFPALDPTGDFGSGVHNMAFVARTRTDPLALVSSVRSILAELNGNVALGNVSSLERVVADASARMAFTMALLIIAAAVALALGAVGIYGVIGYIVGQRTGEIGVRMALGARPGEIAGMVLRQSGAVVAAGLAVGLLGALALTRVMTSLLYEVSPMDPLTYAGVTVFLAAIAAIATWLPARRAARLDPVMALRTE